MKTTSMKISDSLYFDGSYRTKDTVTADKYLETSTVTMSFNYVCQLRKLFAHELYVDVVRWEST